MKHLLQRYTNVVLAVGLFLSATSLASATGEETDRRVRFNRGVIAFQEGDYSKAESFFAQLVQENDQNTGALYWLGLCQLQRNKYGLAAESLNKVLELDSERVAVKLDYAIALVGQDDYAAGRQVLRDFVESGAGDESTRTLAQFFLGVSEYNTENYEAALEALAQADAGATDPSMQANIAWYRSWVLTEQLKFEEASKEFQRVSELSVDVDQQARARTLAQQVATGVVVTEEVRPLEFRLDLGLSYDTNVVLLGDDTSLPINLATNDDLRFGLSTNLRFVHPLNENWLIGLGGNTYNSWHSSLQEYNVQTYGGRMFLNYFASEQTTFGLQYEYDFSLVNNEAFMSRNRVTPSVRYVEAFHEDGTSQTATTLFYAYEDRNYHEELFLRDDDRDGDYHTIGLVQSFNLCQPRVEQSDERWLSAALGYRYLNESTQGNDFDMSGQVLSARLSVPLAYDLLFEFSGQWTWEDYWQPNSQDWHLREREDFIQRYIWSLGREFELESNITLALKGQIAWTIDDSNVRNRLKEAVFSYDRVIYGLTLSIMFN